MSECVLFAGLSVIVRLIQKRVRASLLLPLMVCSSPTKPASLLPNTRHSYASMYTQLVIHSVQR